MVDRASSRRFGGYDFVGFIVHWCRCLFWDLRVASKEAGRESSSVCGSSRGYLGRRHLGWQ